MKYQPITLLEILAKKHLDQLTVEDKINWALTELNEGKENTNLKILAGLETTDNPFEIDEYFEKALSEINDLTFDEDAYIMKYAKYLMTQLINKDDNYKEIVNKLSKICIDHDYDNRFFNWYNLDEAIIDIENGDYPFSYEEAEKFLKNYANEF